MVQYGGASLLLPGATAPTRYAGGTTSGAPVSGTFAVGDFVIDETGLVWICTAAGTPGTWANAGASAGVSSFNARSGVVVPGNADYLAVASGGLTGAVAATRYVGGTASGAPVAGTFAKGDFVIDQTGVRWTCTAAGTPGTWVSDVASIVAADTSIVVGGTASAPTIATGTLDVVAAQHPPAANWSNNSKKITSLANGTAAADAAAFGQTPAGGGLAPLTTAGDLLIANATPAPARLAVGTAGQVLGVSGGLPAWGSALALVATTGTAGYTLVNGTGTILTWTSPNDGNLHLLVMAMLLHTTSNMVGGLIAYGIPGEYTNTALMGSEGVGYTSPAGFSLLLPPNNTVNLVQNSALTAGAAVLFAAMWGW